MKIAVASSGSDITSDSSKFFGRAPNFVIAELEAGKIVSVRSLENWATSASGGAGIKTAQLLANEGVDVIIAGAMGPNAFEILNRLGIKLYSSVEGSVEENLKLFTGGKLSEINSPASSGGKGYGRGSRGMF